MNIESGIPVPPRLSSGVRDMARTLEVGQSIMFAEWKQCDSARHALFKVGRKYKLRKLRDGWRLWRTA
jgi:hypothetical protein